MRLVFALLLGVLAACSPAQPPAAAPEPALWRISDSDSVIWLFGTVHVLRPDTRWRGPRFEAAFRSAGELVEETDIDDARGSFAQLVARYGTLPPGDTLAAHLDADTHARMVRIARELGLDPAQLDTARPWRAANALSLAYAMRQGEQPQAGVENVITPLARRRSMRLSYLETPEQQILTLADLSPAAESTFLTASIREIENDRGDIRAMERAWARGDTDTLERLLDAQLHDAGPEVYTALIARRNELWADEIARRLDGSGRIFVAVGAAHLLGPDGVVALLRARGIRVEGP